MMYGGGWKGLIIVLISAHALFCLATATTCTTPIPVSTYTITPNPIPIANNNSPTTVPSCFTDIGILSCPGDVVLLDNDTGSAELDTSKVFAWDREVNIVFTFPVMSPTKVRQVNLFFYNIPSSGIGLPPAELFWSDTNLFKPDGPLSHTIVGNQDLSQDDRTLRNVSLAVTTDQDSIPDYRYFRICFTFPAETSLIDWILLSEIQLCGGEAVSLPTTNITFISMEPILLPRLDNVVSAANLSCTVADEGSFQWQWTSPPGITLSQMWVADGTRTSIVQISQISAGDYTCLASFNGKSANISVQLNQSDGVPSSTPSITSLPSIMSPSSIMSPPSIMSPSLITSPLITSLPSSSSSDIGGIIGSVVGALVMAIIVVVVLITVIMLARWKQCNGKLQTTFNKKNYTPEPLYSKVKRSSPPPLPNSLYFTDTYTTADNRGSSGHLELVDMNNQHNSISSKPSEPDPVLLKVRHEPYSQINPSYTQADCTDGDIRSGRAPSLDMADSPGQINIFAEPSQVPSPSSHRPSSPPSHPAPIYSESITPSHFREARSVSPTETELHPYAPIYCDPQPLKRSEVPMEVTAQQICEKRYLGVGRFGQVVLAETTGLSLKDLKLSTSDDDKSISILVALKKLKPDSERPMKEGFEKEIKFMSRLNNDNIVRLLGICLSENPFIIMEYMENGDLNRYLRKFEIAPLEAPPGENQLPPSTLLYMALQVAMGMQYLASLRFVHRDLATRNCLVGANYLVKIADFGMSRSLYSSNYYQIRGCVLLPIRWMANECFYGQFTEKTDVWAFGVTVWEIFTFAKKQPYEGMSDQEVIDDSVKGPDRQLLPRPEDCPPEVYEIMLRCWEHEPSERADFEEIQSSLAALHVYSDIP